MRTLGENSDLWIQEIDGDAEQEDTAEDAQELCIVSDIQVIGTI